MRNNERLIQFFDVSISGRSTSRDINHTLIPPKSIDEIMHHFIELKAKNKNKKQYKNYEFSLVDIQEKADCWILLINLIDTGVADQVTNKIGGSATDREVIEFRDQRGLEISSHIIIYKQPDAVQRHLVLYEKSFSIPFAKSEAFLNSLAKEAMKEFESEYTVPHPSGANGKMMKVYCHFSFLGHPSDEFRQELETGKISGIKLSGDVDIIRGYDANMYPEIISTDISMSVKAVDVLRSGGNWLHLTKAIRYANNLNAAFVRLQFIDTQGNTHSATLSSDTQQLLNSDKYIKKAKIQNFSAILKTAYSEINSNITDRMIQLRP